jgi:DNA-binding transcriptional LysR family regulator
VELRQLQYFAAIARQGGLRHAADDLNISPGNLSEQIKFLENELEVRLFERGPRGLRLTQAGVAFLERVDEMLVALKIAREEMRDFAHLDRGQLLVGALPGLGSFWLTEFLVVFLSRYPHVDLRSVERAPDQNARQRRHPSRVCAAAGRRRPLTTRIDRAGTEHVASSAVSGKY